MPGWPLQLDDLAPAMIPFLLVGICFYFKTEKSSQLSRLENNLRKGRFRTDGFKFSFFSRILDLGHTLPVTIRTTDQLSLIFKRVNEFYIAKFNLNKDKVL